MTEVEIVPESKKARSSYAAFIRQPEGSITLYGDQSSLYPDKMGVWSAKPYHERLKLIRFFYEFDPVAGTAVDKFIDLGITGFTLDMGQCSDREMAIYEAATNFFLDYLNKAALEYMLSGLVIPQNTWKKVNPREIGVNRRTALELPDKVWILDPMKVVLKFEGATGDVVPYIKIDEELRYFIMSKGTYPDGTKDVEKYKSLVESFPDFVDKVRSNATEIRIDDAFLIRRKPKTYDPYPTPYLQKVIESLEFKRNLRKMDYSIASRVISAIMLIRLGNDEYPLTEDDEDQLSSLKSELTWRNRPDNIERVFQLFGNHTLQINWVYPDTSAMLSQDKYTSINEDIFYGLGIPRILMNGETSRSATSQAEFAMFSPASTITKMRSDLLTWVQNILMDIKERNGLDAVPTARFEELRLYDLEKLSKTAATLFERNAISLTSLARSAGYKFEDEVVMKAHERELMAKHKIPEFPSMPFSPRPNIVNQETDDAKGVPKDQGSDTGTMSEG